jgi:hypothetical protein
MFGFSSSSPIDSKTELWIKECFAYFMEKLGKNKCDTIKMILPVKENFPIQFDGSYESIDALLKTICKIMSVNRENIILTGFSNQADDIDNSLKEIMPVWYSEGRPGAAGYYSDQSHAEKVHISIKNDHLKDPISLVATITHELCHYILLNRWNLPHERDDMEPMTDLLTIYFGMGIFTANAAIQFNQWQDNQRQGWSMARQGYLTLEIIGFALALWAVQKKELNPVWLKHLCTDAKAYCRQSIKYLLKKSN